MEIIKEKFLEISIVDPVDGSRIKLNPDELTESEIVTKLHKEKSLKKEIRKYYLPNKNFELIVTEIPPGHIQSYHSHHILYEATLVLEGKILVKIFCLIFEVFGKKK